MNGPGTSGLAACGDVSLCSLRAGAAWYGIETSNIREVLAALKPQHVPLAPKYIAGVVPYRGEVLTTVGLRILLGLEPSTDPGPVLVFDDGDSAEQFGLMVDQVGRVVSIARNTLEPNPRTLDAPGLALFAGAYRTPSGLIVRLAPERLRPARLAASGLFGAPARDAHRGIR